MAGHRTFNIQRGCLSDVLVFEQEAAEATEKLFSVLSCFLLFLECGNSFAAF